MNVFKLEEYLAQYEFSAKYLLCCSDAETFAMSEIIDMATPADKKGWDELRLGYTEPYGHPLLREKIADCYPGLSDENILCFAGAEEGIFCALTVLVQPGDHAIVLTPCYQSLLETARSKGADVTEIPLKEENQWRIDLDAISHSIRPQTRCIIINFPHNPTGQVIEEDDLIGLIQLCESKGIWLFSDEVYRLLGRPDKPWAPPAACLYDKAMSLGVMSKAYGMAGLRVGWIACRDKAMIHQMKQMKDYLSICNSAPSEIMAIFALNNQETILRRNNEIVADNLSHLDQFFLEYSHLFEWIRPQGGCVGFVKYKGRGSIDVFCQNLVTQQNVLLIPASIYDYQSPYFRIGFGRKNMPECLEQFKTFLHNGNF